MNNISNSAGLAQGLNGRANIMPIIRVMEYGFMDETIKRNRVKMHTSPQTHQRGKITCFSAASRRRLRETLLSKHIPNSICLGVTLTVPWDPEKVASVEDRWAVEFHSFRRRFERTYPHSSLIWRVELQSKRKAPHLHGLAYISVDDVKNAPPVFQSDAERILILSQMCIFSLSNLWHKSVDISDIPKYRSFFEHGAQCQSMDGRDRMGLLRYLCDHTSKHKQAQLGWQGRQWGVIAPRNLQPVESEGLTFDSDLHRAIWRRVLARYDAAIVQDSRAPFGCWYRPSRRKFGVHFLRGGGDAAMRIYNYSRNLAAEKIGGRI